MPRWLWWTPLAVLTLVAGLLLFRQGWIRAHLNETDVISHYAALYVAETGGEAKVTDCVARPGGQSDIWLVVRCEQPRSGRVRHFPLDWSGRLIDLNTLDLAEPQT